MTPQEMRDRLAAEASGEEVECCGLPPDKAAKTQKDEDEEFEALDMDEFFEAAELLHNCRDMFKRVLKESLHPTLRYRVETLSDEVGQFIEGFVFSSDDEEQTIAAKKKE